MAKTNPTAAKIALRHYMQQIWTQRRMSIPGILLPGIGNVFVGYIPPLVVAAIITRFANQPPTLRETIPYLLLFAGTWFTGEILWRIAFLCLNRTDSRGMRNLYLNAMNELFKKDIAFFHNNFAGSLTKKTIGYGKSFEGFVDTLAFSVSASLVPLLFAGVILWRFSPWLVLALVGLSVVVIAIIVPLTRARKKLVDVRETASNKMAGHVADVIGNIDAVQAFAHEKFEAKHHEHYVSDYMTKARRSWDYHTLRIDLAISPIYVGINVIGLALAIAFGKNAASMAIIFVTFNYYTQATRILWEFNRIYRNIENALSDAGQFTELLLEEPKLKEADHPIAFAVPRGEITFSNVVFTYANKKKPLFKNLNLHIAAGEKVALVGHSGGGKTTVTKMLLRFVDVDSGEILIDEQNIAAARLHDLRTHIAYVPQEPAMFHRSIKENIRYGLLDASDEAVYAAAKKANAHDFISQLPEGYETLVGERGVKLSGGQRQRIAIARAILKDAPILVLDEATSALDSESEALIQDALRKLMQQRTAIVIAHRLSTIQKMDRIVVLDEGQIVEQGTHGSLLKHKGLYAKLWHHQSGGFIEE